MVTDVQQLFDKPSIDAIRDGLMASGQTIAVAESVTSGLMQTALSCGQEASKYFQGGITAYNVGQKYKHLFVEPLHAIASNCVSEKVAVQMAMHICTQFRSDWGVGITGYSSPVPESGNELFAYFAVVRDGTIVIRDRINIDAAMEPIYAQLKYVDHVLKALKKQFQ